MFNTVRQKIIAFLRDAAFRRRRRQFLFVLAAFTVFCTTYMLILPAITLDSQGGGYFSSSERSACKRTG